MTGFDFSGKRVLVTGASHGIGYGVAAAFARAGADLTILSSTSDITDAAAEIGRICGRSIRAEICDITDREAVRHAVGGLGSLDVLVNNAGLELVTPMLEPGEEVEKTFARIIEINVIGTYYVTREALPLMGAGGAIVITSSIWGKTGAADFAAYVTSKHANIGFMRVLAFVLITATNAVGSAQVAPRIVINPAGPSTDPEPTPTATSSTTPTTTTTSPGPGAGSGAPPYGSAAAAYPPLAATGRTPAWWAS